MMKLLLGTTRMEETGWSSRVRAKLSLLGENGSKLHHNVKSPYTSSPCNFKRHGSERSITVHPSQELKSPDVTTTVS
ncbi:hypothetical protein NL676_030377 [Syzygium grande]|nr:hypothetical protein NL676_030377 [Syzygium grande]